MLNFLIQRLLSILLRADKERIREILISLLEKAYSAANATSPQFDDVLAASALAIVKDDDAWSEITDFLSKTSAPEAAGLSI